MYYTSTFMYLLYTVTRKSFGPNRFSSCLVNEKLYGNYLELKHKYNVFFYKLESILDIMYIYIKL